MSIDKISIPKKVSISLTIAKVPISNTKPTIAFVILPFADSRPALSPPDNIQLIAPKEA